MLIQKKRIRNVKSYTGFLKPGESFLIGIKQPSRFLAKLKRIGFGDDLINGSQVLPRGSFGPVSRFNANGKNIVHKDLPMETAHRTVEWHWVEFHGPYRVPQSKLVDVPYKRYPRTFIHPPAIEFSLVQKDNELVLVSPILENTLDQEEKILHVINLFLEIFGECDFFGKNLTEYMKVPIKKLNWRVLPQGRMPWERLQQELSPVIIGIKKGNRPLIFYRLETINKYSPEFVAVGQGGFHGYVVLGFPQKNLFILESIFHGNATYVFGQDWEKLSKMTKAEILDDKLQEERLIHRQSWEKEIGRILKKVKD